MPIYDSNGNLKTSSTTKLEIQASGSVVTTSASLLNFSGSGGIGVHVTNYGLNGVLINVSGSDINPLVVASGTNGQIVNSNTTFINFAGSGVTTVVNSGSGVTVTINTGSGGNSGALEILSGSGEQVTSSAYFLNFAGSGVSSVEITGSGVTVTIAGGSGGGIAVASGSGEIVTSSADYINFEGTAVRSVVQSGSGVSVHIDHRPLIDFLVGFGEGATDADINAWQMSFDPLSGSAYWCVAAIISRDNWVNGEAEQRIWSTSNQFLAGGGATLAFTETAPVVYSVDSVATLNTATGGGENSYRSKALFVTVRHDDGLVTIDTNGYYTNGFSSGATSAYQASGFPFTVGASGQPLNINGAEGWAIHAVAYVTRSVSRTEVLEWWHNVYSSGTMTDIPNSPGNGLNGAWRVAANMNPSGSTWVPFIGGNNLIKTGSKAHSTSSIPLYW